MRDAMALVVVLGGLLTLPYLARLRRAHRPDRWLALGLAVAAAIYVGFALAGSASRSALWVEAGGLLLFGGIALAGVRWSPYWLVLGWTAHVVWDLTLHPNVPAGYVPGWYPPLCVGFDLVVGGFALALLWRSGPGDDGPLREARRW